MRTKRVPQAIPVTVSQHRMTLRSRTHDSVHGRDSAVRSNAMTTQRPHASTSALLAFSTTEPVVRATSPMPPGYSFVPKGDPYLTRNCRRHSQQSHQVVYAVVNDEKKQIGIRVPRSIHAAVSKSERATRMDRQQIVRKRDESIEKSLREAILKLFPRLPHEELSMIIRRATAKRRGRVGRTGTIETAEKARLAVQAHIRHTKTNYEGLLKSGTSREGARAMTSQRTFDLLREWGLASKKRQIAKSHQKIGDKIASLKKRASPNVITKTPKQEAPIMAEIPDMSQQEEKAAIVSPGKAPPSLSAPASLNAATRHQKVRERQRHKRQRRAEGRPAMRSSSR
ncbi:hypothetical protein F4823DRAFT_582585 [Ustulina deusta]|nr:hypothetical protein F4823DRAFT_582585 [Ustulina deusta]